MRQRIRWLALHGVIRGLSKLGARRGDPQARLIADPTVRDEPGARSPTNCAPGARSISCRAVLMTVRPRASPTTCCAPTTSASPRSAATCPSRCTGSPRRPTPACCIRCEPPSLLSVEPPDHTRYRKLVSSVFTTRAVAALRERVERPPTTLLDDLDGEHRRRRRRRPLLLAAAGRGDRRHPRRARRGPAAHPALRRARRAQPRHRAVLAAVPAGAARASSASTAGWPTTCSELRRNPGDDLMSQIIQASDEGAAAQRR